MVYRAAINTDNDLFRFMTAGFSTFVVHVLVVSGTIMDDFNSCWGRVLSRALDSHMDNCGYYLP